MRTQLSRASLVLGLFCIMGMAYGEEHERLAPERRRPLSRIRSWVRGTDLTIRGISTSQGRMAASCQSTPVAKKELESPAGMCRLAYLTAAHCVDSPFESIEFLGIGQVLESSMKVSIPQDYSKKGGQNSREPQGGDSATLIFDVSCDKAQKVIPVPLAPTDSRGQTVINSNHVFLQKREEQTTGNRGGGAQIQADLRGTEGPMFKFYAPSPQGYAIVGGDSGGPIFNEKGQLVCPISGSEYEFKREQGQLSRIPDGTPDKLLDPFTVVCDKHAIARLRNDLAEFGLAPVSTSDAEELSQLASQQPLPGPSSTANGGSAVPIRPLFGSAGSLGSPADQSTPDENGCANGVCPLPSRHNQDTVPGLQGRPQVDSAPETQSSIPARTTGGMKEVGPVRSADLQKVFEDAKKKGFKHIVVRYGNDAGCHYCRLLAGELRSQFGRDSDVLVIKVEDSVINPQEGIPQSQLLSLDENGNWIQQGETNFGSGVGALYKKRVQALRAKKPKQQQQQQQQEALPQPQSPKPQTQQQQGFSQGPNNQGIRGVYNGYQYEPVRDRTGLHYRRSEEQNSVPTAIFLKRMPDGSRRAARREADGTLSFLSQDAEDGLKQYYRANQDKVSKLSEKHRAYVEDFLRGAPNESQGQPRAGSPRPPQLPLIDHSVPKSIQRAPKSLNNGNFKSALPPSTGTVPTHQTADHNPERDFPRSLSSADKSNPLHSAIGRCIDCHGADSGRKLILPVNPEQALQVLDKNLSKHGPINPEMVVKMAESSIHGSLSDEEKKALYQHLFGTTDLKTIAKLEEPTRPPAQDMDPQQLAKLRENLPQTTNPFLDSILRSPSTRFYTDKDRPAVYQVDKDTLGAGEGIKFRDDPNNVGQLGWKDFFRKSADTAKVFFKGLLGAPAGLQNSSDADYRTIKFIRNPTENGSMTPTDISAIPSGLDSHKIDWKFPRGTVVGEIILVKDPTTGKDQVLQVRTRTKTGENTWQPDIYQAFPTAKSFSDRIKTVYGNGEWQKDPELKRMVEHLEKAVRMPEQSVTSDYSIPVYSGKGGVDELPDLAPEKVARLMKGAALDSSLNKRWRIDGETESFAPTTRSQFHIVPKNYEAHTLEVSEASCMRCHQNAGTNFGVINPHAKRNDGAPFAPPDAYGSIYGRDGIFSWHPFSSDRFSYQNFGNGVRGPKTDNRYDARGNLMLQSGWLQSGLIRWLGSQKR